MSKISKYEDFLLENQFQQIIWEIFKVVENNSPTMEWDFTKPENKVNVGDTITWDFEPNKNKPIKDEDPIQIEWEIQKQTRDLKKDIKKYIDIAKSKASKFRTKVNKFKDYLNQGEEPIEFDIKLFPIEKIKSFIQRLDKDQVKKYFDKFVNELKDLPEKVKKELFTKLAILIFTITSLPISELITDSDILREPILKEVKDASMSPSKEEVKKEEPKEVEKKEFKGAKFEIAQKGVHKIEGVYTSDRDDKGNWTGNQIGSGTLLGTKFGIAAPTLVNYYKENNLGNPTQGDMKNLTYETALDIYKKDYWEAQKLGNFKSQSLANVLYDGCVNQGPGATLDILTDALEDVNIDSTNVNSWNDFHDELIDDVNELPTKRVKKLFHIIKDKRWEKYQGGKKKYQKGWKNRLDSITFNDDIEDQKNLDIS